MIRRVAAPDAVPPIPFATLVTIAQAIGYDPADVVAITINHDVVEVETATGWVARHPVAFPPTAPPVVEADPPES